MSSAARAAKARGESADEERMAGTIRACASNLATEEHVPKAKDQHEPIGSSSKAAASRGCKCTLRVHVARNAHLFVRERVLGCHLEEHEERFANLPARRPES